MSASDQEPFYKRSIARTAADDNRTLDEHFDEQNRRLSKLESRGRELPEETVDWPEIDDEGE